MCLENDEIDFSKRLRPEYFCELDSSISADCFINLSHDSMEDDSELINVCEKLRNDTIR